MKYYLLALFLCFPSLASAADDWDFVLAPYALLPGISGDTSVGRAEGADVEVDAGDILDALELGGMLHFEAHHKSKFGLIFITLCFIYLDKANILYILC